MLKKLDERQWLSFGHLTRMLNHLRSKNVARTKVGRRKLRLFACACCRAMTWTLSHVDITDPGSGWTVKDEWRSIVKVAERFADGGISEKEMAAQHAVQLQKALDRTHVLSALSLVSKAMLATASTEPVNAAKLGARYSVYAASNAKSMTYKAASRKAADLLREIFGNPFRPVALDQALASWKTSVIPALAQTIYQERRFEDLPILADALEEAGCRNVALLAHCRTPGDHYLGCWVVDLLLGKG